MSGNVKINSPAGLIKYINKVGFLPLFANGAPGFSVEDIVPRNSWWTGDLKTDPWEWREIITHEGGAVYGKFFGRKAGFISKEWFPVFANYRRNGYDFDARWEDGLAPMREKKIMDLFDENEELYSYEIKRMAGFGKEGEKNFEGVITDLQMNGYIVTKDFRQRKRRDGTEYGWSVSVYTTAEILLGAEVISKAYKEDPSGSLNRVLDKIREGFPEASDKQICRAVGVKL